MPDVMTDKTVMENAGTIGEKISALAQAVLRENASLSKYFRDVSMFAVKGVDKIVFPGIGSFAVANRAHGTTNDKQAPAVFKDSLDLDQNAFIKYGIDGSSEIQSTLNWRVESARIAAEDHVDYFEGKLVSAVQTFAQPVDVTLTTADENKFAKVIAMVAMRKAYIKSKSKIQDALWIIDEEDEAAILANPALYQVAGLGNVLIENGSVTKILGIPVEVKLNAGNIHLVNTKAVNYGFQLGPKYAEQPDINFGSEGILCVMDQLFGVGASYVIPVGQTNAGKSKVIFKLGTLTPYAP